MTPYPIDTILTWVKSGEIAIPEIQRPFVWDAVKVRKLLDSLYWGYPVGYLIAWRNPNVRLKDGTTSAGKRVLIDGQQRVTALMAALLGHQVLNKDYETVRIRIAFQPKEERFEVLNPAIAKDPSWIPDVATIFSPDAKLLQLTKAYVAANPGVDEDELFSRLENLRKIVNNSVGVIELAEDLDIETVTEIFIRVNREGAQLSQADFAMSKIASNETYGGNVLRKAIDYFCHLAVAPEFIATIERNDSAFVASEFFPRMRWLKDGNEDIYDPSYTDMLRVAFTSRFRRGKLQDLVALLSGRNFETKQYEEAIVEQSFADLKLGIFDFMSQTHFDRLSMILRSGGYITSDLIRSQNAVNFAYVLYLVGRSEGMHQGQLERLVRRWYVLSVLRGRYTGAPETQFDSDMRQIEARGLRDFVESVVDAELSEGYWTNLLPQEFSTSSAQSPQFIVFQAAQAKLGDCGFLSRDIAVSDLLLNRSDVHHVYPRNHLKGLGMARSQYNQVANFVLAQSEINIAIGDKAPSVYFSELREQCEGGPLKYGSIDDLSEMRASLRSSCIPESMLDGEVPEYEQFLQARRGLMAAKIRRYFEGL